MACTNCFTGCTEITPDKCVKYTGPDVAELEINNGDTLLQVETSIISYLIPMLTGLGIKPDIASEVICEVVQQYLPPCNNCSGFTLNEILTAIIQSICNLQEQINDVNSFINTLEGDYDVDCLTGVISSSGTHDILQATITKLCLLLEVVTELSLTISTNYVKIEDINTYISTYLAESGTSTKLFNRMIPNVAVEWYGDPYGKFDVSGAGIGDWEKIYLCNGNNGAPDKRGRVAVGATGGMGGGAFNAAVDPGIAGNPTYNLLTIGGANNITLNSTQIPSHTHIATVTDPGHSHLLFSANTGGSFIYPPTSTSTISWNRDYSDTGSYRLSGYSLSPSLGKSSSVTTGITVSNSSVGGGTAHSNVQPVLACYYIIYLP